MMDLEEAEEAHSLGMFLARTKLIDQQVVFLLLKILSRAIKTKTLEKHSTQRMITIGKVTICREVILMRIWIVSSTT